MDKFASRKRFGYTSPQLTILHNINLQQATKQQQNSGGGELRGKAVERGAGRERQQKSKSTSNSKQWRRGVEGGRD